MASSFLNKKAQEQRNKRNQSSNSSSASSSSGKASSFLNKKAQEQREAREAKSAAASKALESNNPAYAALQKYGDGKTGTAANKAVKGTSKQSTERKVGQTNALGGGTYKKTKLDSTLNAAVYNTAGSLANLWGTIQALDESLKGTDEYTAVGGLNKITDREGDKKRAMEANRVKSVLNTADSLMQRSAEEQAEAKEGLGKFGQGLVDFGVAGAQFAGDVVANAILPGSGLAAMGARAAGGGAYEARQAGLDLDQQLTAGAKSAAIELLTEKLFGAGSKIAYGKGIVKNQNVVNSLVNRLAKTDKGRTALKVLAAANEEGLEEVASDILNPAADWLLNLRDSEGNLLDELSAEQMLEDYIIGAALGAFGSGANVVSGQYGAENAQQRAYEEYQKALVNEGLASEQGSNAQVTAEEYKKILDQSSKRGNRNLSDKETENMLSLLQVEQDSPAVSARLKALGQDADTQTVSAIIKTANGEKLSKSEQQAFAANPYAQRVVNEMTDTEGVTSNSWYSDGVSSAAYTPRSTGISAETAQQALNTQLNQRAVAGAATFNQAAQAEGKAAVAQALAQQTEASPEFIQKVYDLNPTADPTAFRESFKAAYTMGETGGNVEALQHVPTLTQAQARIAYTMGADKAKAVTNNTQEVNENGVHLRESSQRIDGQNTVGQVSGLAESTGRDSSGQTQSRPADSAGTAQADGQIVYNGVVQQGARRTTGRKTTSMRKAEKAAAARGYSVTFFEGGNIKVDGGEARGVVDPKAKTVYVRTDHPDFTAHQIMRHELGHADIAEGKVSLDSIREELHEDFTDSELDAMAQAYAEAYEGSDMTAEEAFEEICCDALGDMNMFSDDGREILARYGESLTKAKKSAERQANQGRAPPREMGVKYSYEGKNKNGIEVYETSDEVKALSRKERQKKFLEIMQNEYRGRTAKFIRNGHAYYATFDDKDVNKNIYGDKRSSNSGYNAKIKVGADGNIFELVENAKYNGSKKETGKSTKAHKQIQYWDYYVKTVQIDNQVYDLVANVRRKSTGDFVYSIQLHTNNTIKASAAQQPNQKVGVNKAANASDSSIPTTSENVKNKYSLEPVKPIQPQNGEWERSSTTEEVRAVHPQLWAVDAESSDTRNPTQISGTVKSYRKIYDALEAEGFDGTILDASSGLGYGTRAGIEEYGFDVEDIEPFPDSSYKPMYTDYSKLNKKYDVIISNAVLNVLPQDQRDALVVKMGKMLNTGGKMFINVRGTDVKNASSKVAIDEDNMEYYISNTGSYQKGFTKKELVAYLSDALGDNYTVVPSSKFGAVSAIVTKKGAEEMLDAKYEASQSKAKYSRELPTRKNVKVSRQAWAQIQNHRMQKYGGRVDTMPSMDYIFANDNLFVVNNYDETRFAIIRKIDPAKDKILADQIVEAFKNGSIETTGDFDRWAKVLRNRGGRGNGDNVHAGNGRTARGNARLDDMAGQPADRGTTANKGRGDNGVSNSLESKKLSELRRENEQLKARVEYWRGQTKPTTVKAVRADDVNRLAREIINMSETDLKPKDIVPQLTKLGEHILNEKELRFTDISNMARRIAVNVVENATAVANEEDVQTHNELKEYLKQHKFKDDGSAEFKDIRNRYKRRFRFDKNGMGVDTAYMELNDMFGEGYFPSDTRNTADQLERIGQVLDNTAPMYVNPNDTYFEDAVVYLRNYILDGVLSDQIRQVVPTYADKANAKLAKANAENARLASEVKQGEKTIAQLQEQNEKRVKEAIRAERKRAQQELKQFKNNVHLRDAKRRETAEKNKYKAQISKNLKTLNDWLLKPDHKNALKHIPGPLQSTVRDFIASVDFTSTSKLTGGRTTQKDMRYLDNLERLHSYITDQNTSEERYSGYFDLPPTFETDLSQFINRVNALARANSGVYTVNNMDSAQLKQLSDIIKTLKKTITDMNKMYQNATFQHAYDAGAADVENLQKITKSKAFTNNVITNKLDRMLMWTEARPAHAFQRFGKGGESIYREFTEGQSTMAFLTKDIIDFTSELYKKNKVDVKAWEKQVHTFKFDGDEISITTPQLMGLYELNKRSQAKQHLDTGGFKVANFKEKFKLKRDETSTGHVLTEQQLGEMFDKLTDAQKKVADEMQRYMAKVGGEWGNYVSIKRFDVEMFKDDNYYPVKVDTAETDSKENDKVDNASLYKLLNMGFTKELSTKANQAIVVYDIFDVFANHMAEMAQYRSFALPVLDGMKWFNYKDRYADGTVSASLRTEMGRAFGTDESGRSFAEDFVKGVLQAYNGAEARGDNSLNARMLNRVNRQAVAFNTRVMIQQPSAIARAALYLDVKDLAAGLKNYTVVAAKKSIEEMHKYSGIAVWKDLGFYDVNVSRGVQELIKNSQNVVSKINEFGMKGAEWADKLTWAAMWDASKAKVKRETKLTEQDEEFFPKVVELFEDTVYNTQVVDTVMTKSAFSRDKSFSTRILSSFMSEPMTTASLVTNQVFKMQMQRAEGKKLTVGDYKQLGKVGAVVAIAAVVNSALASLADAWRDDDEYATFGQKWENAFRTKLADELMPISYLPFGSLVWNTYKIFLDHADKRYFGLDVYGNETNIPWADMVDNLTKALDIFAEIEEEGEDSRYTKYGGYYKIAQILSQLAGIPISNVVREAVTAYNNFAENKIRSYEPSPESAIKYAWNDGYLSDEEAMEWLQNEEAMGDEAISEGEAYLRIEQWKANENSAYFKVYDAIDNGGDVKEAVDEMLDHGKEKQYVKTAITNHCKEMYIKGTEAERKKIRQALYDTGLYGSVNEVIEKCNGWLKEK